MRKIEIITPQNVPIQYQLANVRERAIAFMLDMLILLISLLFLFLLLQTLGSEDSQQLIYLGVLMPIFLFYSFAFELFFAIFGQLLLTSFFIKAPIAHSMFTIRQQVKI